MEDASNTTADSSYRQEEEIKLTDSLANSKAKKEISIRVCDPFVREEKLSKYILYTVKGFDREGSFEVLRRFSDFNVLRGILVNRWPGCYIPPIPEKKVTGNLDPGFIEDRRKFLDVFLNRIAVDTHIWYGDEFQSFLRSNAPDIEKVMNNLPKLSYEDMIQRYTSAFNHLSGRELNNEAIIKISTFHSYIKKVSVLFENFKKYSKAMVQAKKQYYEQLSTFHQSLMCEYEKNCLSEFIGQEEKGLVFSNPNDLKLNNSATKIKENIRTDSYEYFYDLIRREAKELTAFSEAIQQREKYEQLKSKLQEKQRSDTIELQKVLAGKTTFKSLLSRKSKDEEINIIEKSIGQTTKEIDNITILLDMITLILTYVEIDKFKSEKVDNYFVTLAKLAKSEDEGLADMQAYWQTVLANENINF